MTEMSKTLIKSFSCLMNRVGNHKKLPKLFMPTVYISLRLNDMLFQEVNNEPQIPNGGNKNTGIGSKYGRMDLADFVSEVDRFSSLVEPIAFVVYCIEDIRR